MGCICIYYNIKQQKKGAIPKLACMDATCRVNKSIAVGYGAAAVRCAINT